MEILGKLFNGNLKEKVNFMTNVRKNYLKVFGYCKNL